MDMSKLCVPVETAVKSTEMLKPISEIAKIISTEYLKKVELNEYCKIVESDLSKFQNKVQTLVSAKNESARIKADYKSRNKINVINSKSLRQALNELYKYKAEMKSSYIATEKALKLKRIKYNKIISGYESAWKEALKEYNADLVFVELLEIQKDNSALEKEIEILAKLTACTRTEFRKLKENIERNFHEKIVEFSKVVIQHKEFSKSNYQIKKDEGVKTRKAEGGFQFKFFRANAPSVRKIDAGDDVNIACTVDVSVFDDMMVPSENLESQNLEDDGYSFMPNEGKQFSDISKDQEDDLEYLNNYQQNIKEKNKEVKLRPVEDSAKAAMVEENESQYFKQQTLEPAENENPQLLEQKRFIEDNFNKQKNNDEKFDNDDREAIKLNSINSESAAALLLMESEDDVQMECEESVSERSYEKQFGNQKESYECQYQKASSVSSEDFPSGENQNESAGPSFKSFKVGDDQSSRLKPRSERGKSDFKSFPGFFTMGDDHETPAPSIFKLF